MKTRKVMEVNDKGIHLICIKTDETVNPYRLYQKWYDNGWHRKQIARYQNLHSVVYHINWIEIES